MPRSLPLVLLPRGFEATQKSHADGVIAFHGPSTTRCAPRPVAAWYTMRVAQRFTMTVLRR
jgi:hypothetical protein